MDLLQTLEIYIPKDAEVKSAPLRSLPKSVLRRIGAPLPDAERSGKPDSKAVVISPLVVRKKGQKVTSYTGNSGREDMFSQLDRDSQSERGPFKMAIVSSNITAYKVLKDIVPGKILFDTDLLPQGSAPQSNRDAVVIYHGRIFLSVKLSRRRQKTRALRASHSAVAESPTKCRSPQASPEPADAELHVTLPQTSPEQPADDYCTTDLELLKDDRTREKRVTCAVTRGGTGREVLHRGNSASSSTSARSLSQSADSVNRANSRCHKDAGGGRGTRDLRGDGAEYMQMDSLGLDYVTTQSNNQSWTRREPQGAVSASTSLQEEFDFKELAEEEKIARMKAKLRLSEAALSKLHSS